MRKVLKVLSALVVVLLIFSGGVMIGRGDLRINGLSRANTDINGSFDYASVDRIYNLLKRDFDGSLNKTELLNGIKSGLVSATGDPYTEYFNPEEAEEFNNQLSGSFTGIGAELGANEDGVIVIVAPLVGYPAEKAGLRPKDVIVGINGQTTSGMSVSQAVRKIRGPADTKVTLSIVRNNGRPFNVSITRAQITIPSVKYEIEGNIGYLKINQFTRDTIDLINKAAATFKKQKVNGLVLDVRSNPGGYLDSAVSVASLWLDSGKQIVTERRGSTILSTKYSSGEHPFRSMPTVVLIDGGSASAAEILAGALSDNKAATLVGTKTFGKGSVQQVEDLPDGAELKITVARWHRPNGENIDKQGIKPDIEVKVSDKEQSAGRDPQKDRAFSILRSKIAE